jgi:hypothetical protein
VAQAKDSVQTLHFASKQHKDIGTDGSTRMCREQDPSPLIMLPCALGTADGRPPADAFLQGRRIDTPSLAM